MTNPGLCTATASKDGHAYTCGLPDGHDAAKTWGHWDPDTGYTWTVTVIINPDGSAKQTAQPISA